ncbi:hypothetical protein VU10_07435, partial [Desulfobulbus sp. US1]|nr:hypothetical protein [Desulfobulbus sp. US1]
SFADAFADTSVQKNKVAMAARVSRYLAGRQIPFFTEVFFLHDVFCLLLWFQGRLKERNINEKPGAVERLGGGGDADVPIRVKKYLNRIEFS